MKPKEYIEKHNLTPEKILHPTNHDFYNDLLIDTQKIALSYKNQCVNFDLDQQRAFILNNKIMEKFVAICRRAGIHADIDINIAYRRYTEFVARLENERARHE